MKKLVALAFALAFTTGQAEAIGLPPGTKMEIARAGSAMALYHYNERKSNKHVGHIFAGPTGTIVLDWVTGEEIMFEEDGYSRSSVSVRESGLLSGLHARPTKQAWLVRSSTAFYDYDSGKLYNDLNTGSCFGTYTRRPQRIRCFSRWGEDMIPVRIEFIIHNGIPVDKEVWRLETTLPGQEEKLVEHRRIILPAPPPPK